MYACEKGPTEMATVLLKSGANIEHKNKNSLTALFVAVYVGNVKLVRLLLTRGALVNESSSDGKLFSIYFYKHIYVHS